MILYLYPEEWTGGRAREVHTLSTCVALARAGCPITLVTAGGEAVLRRHLEEIAGEREVRGLELVFLARRLGPIKSAAVFAFHFRRWLRTRPSFAQAFVIHLKAAPMLECAGIPYAFEAHEIFAETRSALEADERRALGRAAVRIATSAALAEALRHRYGLPDDFHIVPNAGMAPLDASVARAEGPFVYCGSIAEWKGLELVIQAARQAEAPLSVVGGNEAEWRDLAERCETTGVRWQPRVPVRDLPQVLAGARAGLIATLPESGSGRYSCPMKLFDYARCGLPVLSTALPSLQSLGAGSWCTRVAEPTVAAWTAALRDFRFDAAAAANARAWSASHTWQARAESLRRVLSAIP